MARDKWAPQSYPIRMPTTTQQQVGRIVNPPRTVKMGGKGESRLNTLKKLTGDEGPDGKGPVSDRGRGRGR